MYSLEVIDKVGKDLGRLERDFVGGVWGAIWRAAATGYQGDGEADEDADEDVPGC
jgi:hypothetical protein